jgi:peptidyl-prolyl cis-trans isomerase B (cyclophilin B)
MLGRIVIGLYGKQVPRTVANFIAMVTGAAGSTYKGTLFHKIIAGQYIQAGKQGSRSEGQVLAPTNLEKNPETVKSSAFALPHRRPGTVSLCLGVNDDEEDRKLSEDYRNVEFLITTGPGPASDLDGSNIVFGTVLEGMDVVSRIAAVPSYQPNIRIKQFNELAEFLGDERAETARKFWDRPLQNVVISGCGIIQPKPSPLPNGQP